MPPVAASFAEYGTSAVAGGSETGVTASGISVTVIDRFAGREATGGFSESVACTMKAVLVPAVLPSVGVPLIRPVAGASVSPAGSVPCTDQV